MSKRHGNVLARREAGKKFVEWSAGASCFPIPDPTWYIWWQRETVLPLPVGAKCRAACAMTVRPGHAIANRSHRPWQHCGAPVSVSCLLRADLGCFRRTPASSPSSPLAATSTIRPPWPPPPTTWCPTTRPSPTPARTPTWSVPPSPRPRVRPPSATGHH